MQHRALIVFALLLGVIHSEVGINIDPTNPTGRPNVTALRALGSTWVRIEFIEHSSSGPVPSDTITFYRTIAESMVQGGVQVLLILDYQTLNSVPWQGSAAQWSAYAENFAVRVQQIATALDGLIAGFEIWNEEDLSQTNVPAASYALLLQLAHQQIKKRRSTTWVVMGGLASGNPQYVADCIRAAGGVLYADQVGLHPYGQRPFPNWPSATWGFGYVGNLVASYAAVSNLPIMITEVGTNDVSVQPMFPYMFFTGIAAVKHNISAVLWFCWSDGMVNPFGLVTENQQPKPSYFSFLNYTKQ